jgi:hypothetical protein
MKTSRALIGLALYGATAFAARAQLLGDTPVEVPSLDIAILNAFPPPDDDPLLDASGNVVMDSSGQPVCDPKEQFHRVKPLEFDPAHTFLVQAAWLNGTGCPTDAAVAEYPATSPTDTFTDSACPYGDPRDRHNEGLLLAKTGPTSNNASAVAELKKVRGISVTELGYDIRKFDSTASPFGSHCGGGAPRFNIVLADPKHTVIFIACNSPPPTTQTGSVNGGWTRLRWNFPTPIGPVARIQIVFDEGQDVSGGPDRFGAAFLDNIDVNGQIVGAGPTDPR